MDTKSHYNIEGIGNVPSTITPPDEKLKNVTHKVGNQRRLLMARHEADREDLFTETAGLTRKMEGLLNVDSMSIVVAGFRADDVLTVYFGSDPMFQFDGSGRLRRAFVDGRLYRAQGTTLARLSRLRSTEETTLSRHDLTVEELVDFRTRLLGRIKPLAAALEEGSVTATRRWPLDDGTIESAVAARLHQVCKVDDWIAESISRR